MNILLAIAGAVGVFIAFAFCVIALFAYISYPKDRDL